MMSDRFLKCFQRSRQPPQNNKVNHSRTSQKRSWKTARGHDQCLCSNLESLSSTYIKEQDCFDPTNIHGGPVTRRANAQVLRSVQTRPFLAWTASLCETEKNTFSSGPMQTLAREHSLVSNRQTLSDPITSHLQAGCSCAVPNLHKHTQQPQIQRRSWQSLPPPEAHKLVGRHTYIISQLTKAASGKC